MYTTLQKFGASYVPRLPPVLIVRFCENTFPKTTSFGRL